MTAIGLVYNNRKSNGTCLLATYVPGTLKSDRFLVWFEFQDLKIDFAVVDGEYLLKFPEPLQSLGPLLCGNIEPYIVNGPIHQLVFVWKIVIDT